MNQIRVILLLSLLFTNLTSQAQPFTVLRDINPGTSSSIQIYSSQMIDFNGTLIFVADDGVHGYELWKTDGTTQNTVLLKDINPAGSSDPINFFEFQGSIYFIADDGTHGAELWRTDGTEGGTHMVEDLNPAGDISPNLPNPRFIQETSNKLFFFFSDTDHGRELWSSDGTEEGTNMVKDIFPGPTDGISPFMMDHPIIVSDDRIFFIANDGSTGIELWVSDGTEIGTKLVKDINPGIEGTGLSRLAKTGNLLLFGATDPIHGEELWRSDGTEEGTYMVKEIDPGPNFLTFTTTEYSVSQDLYYFVPEIHSGPDIDLSGKLWRSDGTEEGTFATNPDCCHYPRYMNPSRDLFYFTMQFDPDHGWELWRSDGTVEGTFITKDITPGPAPSIYYPQVFSTSKSGLIFLTVYTPGIGNEIWRSDGTESGTFLLKDLNPGPNSQKNYGCRFADAANLTFILDATDGIHGEELWKTDGTESGTLMVQDFEPGSGNSIVWNIIASGSKLFAIVQTSAYGNELWVADLAALPVKLTSFLATLVKDDSHLSWQTTNEDQLDYFAIERSFDRTQFETIGQIAARNLPGVHSYQYIDRDILYSNQSSVYYRLKIFDLDGKFDYSEIEKVNLNLSEWELKIFPNPVKENMNIYVKSFNEEKVGIEIYNLQGALILIEQKFLKRGSTRLNLDISSLSSGNYILIIRNGTEIRKKPFIKN